MVNNWTSHQLFDEFTSVPVVKKLLANHGRREFVIGVGMHPLLVHESCRRQQATKHRARPRTRFSLLVALKSDPRDSPVILWIGEQVLQTKLVLDRKHQHTVGL